MISARLEYDNDNNRKMISNDIETRRVELQQALDAQKTQKQRNVMGQFATPYPLAYDIMKHMRQLCAGSKSVSLLEPSVGLGAFVSAFHEVFGSKAGHALGFEIDSHYYEPAKELWQGCDIDLRNADFLAAKPDSAYDMIVANPPYVRHHHIDTDTKLRLKNEVKDYCGINISGLAGLYCHFMILSTKWLRDGGLSCWLVPCEFMEVNYGRAVKKFLLRNVELISIHRFVATDVQFADALVSSCVVVFRNACPKVHHKIVISEGGSVSAPGRQTVIDSSNLSAEEKWTSRFDNSIDTTTTGSEDTTARLGDFFTVKRGIATGDNHFFILDSAAVEKYSIPRKFLVPVLPSPRYFKAASVAGRPDGLPDADRQLFLFNCDLDEPTLKASYPTVWQYVRQGEEREVNKGYICSRRTPWYSCEKREPAPFVMPYMGRGESSRQMFRFILNNSDAITTNVYLLLYPKKNYAQNITDEATRSKVWNVLNSISKERLMSSGRVYGGGLYKLEPKELMDLPVPEMTKILKPQAKAIQLALF